jgi:hypothetical protein
MIALTQMTRVLWVHGLLAVLALGAAQPAQAQNPYDGVLTSSTCAPGIAFTAVSMNWDLDYLYDTDFGGLGPCIVPDLSALLGRWTMVSQEMQVGSQSLLSNVAGKTLQILPAAVFNLDPLSRGVMAQEEWHTEKFCIEGASSGITCTMTLPALPPGLGVAPCRDAAVFTGAMRSDVYVQSGGASPSQPTGPFTLRANIRTDIVPIAIRCPGADVDVTCNNCASMSIGKLTMELEHDAQTDVLTAVSDIGGRRLVQTYRRETTVTLGEIFNPDGSLQ